MTENLEDFQPITFWLHQFYPSSNQFLASSLVWIKFIFAQTGFFGIDEKKSLTLAR